MLDETWFLVAVGIGLLLRSVRNSWLKGLHVSWLSTGGYLCAVAAVLADAAPPVVLVCIILFGVGEFLHQTGSQGIPEEEETTVLQEQLEREERARAARGGAHRSRRGKAPVGRHSR